MQVDFQSQTVSHHEGKLKILYQETYKNCPKKKLSRGSSKLIYTEFFFFHAILVLFVSSYCAILVFIKFFHFSRSTFPSTQHTQQMNLTAALTFAYSQSNKNGKERKRNRMFHESKIRLHDWASFCRATLIQYYKHWQQKLTQHANKTYKHTLGVYIFTHFLPYQSFANTCESIIDNMLAWLIRLMMIYLHAFINSSMIMEYVALGKCDLRHVTPLGLWALDVSCWCCFVSFAHVPNI